MSVIVDLDNRSLKFGDKGVTIRTLLSAANSGYLACGRREWNLVLDGTPIGKLKVKTNGNSHARSNPKGGAGAAAVPAITARTGKAAFRTRASPATAAADPELGTS